MESAWLRELRRLLSLKTQFVLHGNISDRFPILGSAAPRPASVSYAPLAVSLPETLRNWGYQIVGIHDFVDGLRFYGESREAKEQWKSEFCRISGRRQSDSMDVAETLDSIRKVIQNTQISCAFILEAASLLSRGPDNLDEPERGRFLTIMKCAREANKVTAGESLLPNMLVLVAPKLNDLPPWLYLDNPRLATISIPRPDEAERKFYLSSVAHRLFWSAGENQKQLDELATMTHGLMHLELESLVELSAAEKISAEDPRGLLQKYKFGNRISPWKEEVIKEKLRDAENFLGQNVKGQSKAIRTVTDILKRASLGLSGVLHSSREQKPKGVLFFAGPTGVGKTELAKSLAKLLFGDETACLRFDMSEFSQSHTDQRLFGAPPGYTGYEAGGELTSAIKKNPFSVLLFDEIDKADSSILDKFLQILEDGRLTSGQGETVFFSECVIIFTSNKGIYREVPDDTDKTGHRMKKELAIYSGLGDDGLPEYSALRESVITGIWKFFEEEIARPELLNRIGNNFVVFDFIRQGVVRDILDMRLSLVSNFLAKENKGWKVDFGLIAEDLARWSAQDAIKFGGRGVINRLETALLNPLARKLFDCNFERGKNIRVVSIKAMDDFGEQYEIDLEVE